MKLFVRNLAWKATNNDLAAFLDSQGYQVTEVRICFNQDNGQSRGFGFVTFATSDMGEQALRDLQGEDFMGRPLQVALAIDKPKNGGSRGRRARRDDGDRDSSRGRRDNSRVISRGDEYEWNK